MNLLFNFEETDEPGCFIGMDEAGYGPNLGPLVIAATKWQTPRLPEACNFATLLRDVVDVQSTCRKTKLHIADSKEVNKGKYGFESLETSAFALFHAAGKTPSTFREIREILCGCTEAKDDPLSGIPWFTEELQVPVVAEPTITAQFADHFKDTLAKKHFGPLQLEAQIVPATQFNNLLTQVDSKGIVLTTLAFELLDRIWNQQANSPTLFVGDKHGGRNRYVNYLSSISAAPVKIIEEARAVSRYRVAATEFRFQTKGEQHLPVAAASIIAKYVRELSMIQFNNYWQQFCPDIKPTKGYPVDAKRYWEQIKTAQIEQSIQDEQLWRMK